MAWPFLPSLASWAAIALVAEVRPNCSTRTPGCAFCAADTAASGRSMIFSACSSVPGSVKFTTTERPSLETVFTRSFAFSGLSISVMPRIAERRPTTSFTAAVTSGSLELLPWMSTCSEALSGNPAALTIMSPRLASPLPAADSSSSFRPTRPPMTVASTTNKIQPRMAVLRCCALHRPALAARLRDAISTCAPSEGGGGGLPPAFQAPGPGSGEQPGVRDWDWYQGRVRGGPTHPRSYLPFGEVPPRLSSDRRWCFYDGPQGHDHQPRRGQHRHQVARAQPRRPAPLL